MSPMFISRGFKGRRRPTTAPERVPPGQHQVEDFPVLSAGPTPHTPLAAWDFVLVAAVAAPRRWTWAEFLALPQETITISRADAADHPDLCPADGGSVASAGQARSP